MDKLHPHAAALVRIGSDVIRDHFEITRQTLYNWRTKGISPSFRKSVVLLGESLGHDMSDLKVAA